MSTVITVHVGEDHSYVFRPGEVTPAIARKVRAVTGMSLLKAQQLLAEDADLDVMAALLFGAALQADPSAELADVEALLNYETEYGIDVSTTGEVDDDPEA